MSKKSWPILYSSLLNKIDHDFLGIKYTEPDPSMRMCPAGENDPDRDPVKESSKKSFF